MIHPTAVIDQQAQISDSADIGPYTVIGADVSIDDNTWVGPHVVIMGRTKIGKGNKIYQFASVGDASQDKKYAEEGTCTKIGDNNTIRECVTIHRGTMQDNAVTKIGNDNLFMAYSHVAHDCVIGDHNIFANSSAAAGHVKIGDHVIFSAYCGVHQFCHVGSHAFVAHGSIVTKDVPPFVMVTGGHSPTVCGINTEGLKRRGFKAHEIQSLRRAYKVIYRQGLRVSEAIIALRDMQTECAAITLFADFLEISERGIVR